MAEHDKRIAMLDCESSEYQRRMDQNLAEITDKLNGLIGYVRGTLASPVVKRSHL